MNRGIEVRQLKLNELSLALIQELVASGIKDYVDTTAAATEASAVATALAAGGKVRLITVAGGPPKVVSTEEPEDWEFLADTSASDASNDSLPPGGLLLADITVDEPNDRFTIAASAVMNINWAPAALLDHLESTFTEIALGNITVEEDDTVSGFHTTRISWDNDVPNYVEMVLRTESNPLAGSTLVTPYSESAEDLVYGNFALKLDDAGGSLSLFSGGPIDVASLTVDAGDVVWDVAAKSISVTVPTTLTATVVTPLVIEDASTVFADTSTPTQSELDAVVLVPTLTPHVFVIV